MCLTTTYCESGDLAKIVKHSSRTNSLLGEKTVLGWFAQVNSCGSAELFEVSSRCSITMCVFVKKLEGISPFDNLQRSTNCLPNQSFITLSSPETAGQQVGRVFGWTCQYPSGFISWVYRGE